MSLAVTALGLETETLQEIATAIGSDQLSTIDPGLSQDDDDPLRQMNVIISGEIADAVEGIQVAYTAFDIDNAEGALLDNIGAFKGRPRLQARNPRVLVTLTLDAGAVVALGDSVSSNIDNARSWLAVERLTAIAAGTYSVTFEATQTSYSALPGELTVIPSLPGWVSATNPAGSQPSRAYETDTLYRARLKDQEDAANGAGTLDSIAGEVALVAGVQSADYRENTAFSVDANGLPAVSWQILVDDGGTQDASNNEIAQVIWDNKPPAGRSFGIDYGIAYDTRGRPHKEYFQRIARIRFVVSATIKVLPGWNTSQAADVKKVMSDYVASLKVGQDVVASRIMGVAVAVPNVEDITNYLIAPFPGPPYQPTTFSISASQRAVLDVADIALTVVQLTELIP